MTWVRLEDDFADHRKVLAVGPKGVCLWVCGLAYANRRPEHDGFIPEAKVLTLYPMSAATRVAERLVEVGLWEAIPGGYRIHDYHDYQPTVEAVERVAQARRSAGQVGGRRSGEARRSKPEATSKQSASHDLRKLEANEAAKVNPVPVPVPVPVVPGGLTSPPETPLGAAAVNPTDRLPPPTGPAGGDPAANGHPPRRRGRRALVKATGAATWRAYADGYWARYGVEPVRNAKVNTLLARLVERLGTDDAPPVAAYYVGHQLALYVRAGHAVELLVRDAEKLRTEWATGRAVTETAARQGDGRETTRQVFADLLDENRARRAREEDADASE